MRFFRFLVAVKDEMKQVSWPDAKQTRKDTSSVIFVALSMAIFLGIVDYLVQMGLKFLA
ncbi:MAG TPA: preprotein translocase subunit SecE [Lactobacillus sp.]|uniref:Protein translocase subunit SecE n=1 Tax=Secundilactobacillus silagincola TaxID=1714681 RepID=A0A1Z5J3X6_9LACO|nr:preprotein translocase subunit SecE [Secundilactobacillus silagincola]GAX08609.1 preprotein translocase subunit SecE [Secundilactobacillus silagincola]HBF75237.1 preprotein translocase subunit SecE [Lactobacillus sp.]